MEQQQTDPASQLLQDIHSGLSFKRRDAADELGHLAESNDDVVIALLVAKESDTNDDVKKAASSALEMPVHQQYLQDHPESIQKAKQTTQSLQKQRARASRHEGRARTSKRGMLIGLILFGMGICMALYNDSVYRGGGIVTSRNSFSYEVLQFTDLAVYGALCLGILMMISEFIMSVISSGSKTQS